MTSPIDGKIVPFGQVVDAVRDFLHAPAGDVPTEAGALPNLHKLASEIRAKTGELTDDVLNLGNLVQSQPIAALPAWTSVRKLENDKPGATDPLVAVFQAVANRLECLRNSAGEALVDYAALETYEGDAQRVHITGYLGTASQSPMVGQFKRKSGDTTTGPVKGIFIRDKLSRLWVREFDGMVNVGWFGAVPDGGLGYGTDNRANINLAIDYCNTTGLGIFLPAPAGSGNYVITGPLNKFLSAGGWVQERVGYDYTSGGAILPVIPSGGSGYTAVTLAGGMARCEVFVSGGPYNPNIGLIHFDNPAKAKIDRVRAVHTASFGVKIDKCWDCNVLDVSVELCGSAAEYAFSMNDADDTCNMTHISRLQVEQSTTKAIFISPNTLSCVIDNIHAERQYSPDPDLLMFQLGGNRCQYNSVRLDAYDSVNTRCRLAGANTTIVGFLCESSIRAEYDVYPGTTFTLISPEIQGTLRTLTDQVGTLIVTGGSINSADFIQGIVCNTTKIASLDIAYVQNVDAARNVFRDCKIGTLLGASGFAAATFFGGEIADPGNLLGGKTVLDGTLVRQAGSSTITVGYRTLVTRNGTRIEAPVNVDFGSIEADDTTFAASLSQSAGPNRSKFNDGVIVLGSVSGIGGQPDASAFSERAYSKNLAAAVGSPRGWMKAGGDWRSVGSLA
ncbi:hypothetical protein [uncultured Pseudacidovorax sp.]|uniref:hypothetical protein n=1 Tax=uncultured Pseudacidovorax sp. TaxID=679313 RepID=UPI0025F53411|nr:hypothetical protein [uncultured Pseudacidovorax sp.]